MKFIKPQLIRPSHDQGFTLLELMVGMSITMIITMFALQTLSNTQREFTADSKNLELSQKSSSILDIIGRDIRQAGEQIEDPKFPAVKVFPNTVDASKGSSLVLYRALVKPLSFCSTTNVVSGSTITSWPMSSNNTDFTDIHTTCKPDPVKSPPVYPEVLQEWKAKRLSFKELKGYAVIYNNNGEVFPFMYSGESESTASINTHDVATESLGTTTFELKPEMPAYLVEKREYLVCGNDLVVRVNSKYEGQCNTTDDSFKVIASNIERLEIQVSMRNFDASGKEIPPSVKVETSPTAPNGTTFPDLSDTDAKKHLFWKDIHFVNVRIKSKDPQERNLADARYDSTLTAEASFYPRNVMSSRPLPSP